MRRRHAVRHARRGLDRARARDGGLNRRGRRRRCAGRASRAGHRAHGRGTPGRARSSDRSREIPFGTGRFLLRVRAPRPEPTCGPGATRASPRARAVSEDGAAAGVRPRRVRARLAPRERTTRFQAFVEHPKTRGSSSLRPTRQNESRVPRILQSHWASETSRRARGCGDARVDGMYNVALYMRAPTVVASRPVRGRASERCARATGAVPTAERARGPRSTRAGSGRAVTRRASSPRGGAFRYSLFALICRAARARPPTDVGASRRRGVTCLPVSGYSMNTSRSQRALRALQSASESFRDFKSGSPRSRSWRGP